MQVLIVQEWFEDTGGSERVVEEFSHAFTKCRAYCLWNDSSTRSIGGAEIKESVLARTPLRQNKILALPLMLLVWRFPSRKLFRDVDLVLVSSHLFAHHFKVPKSVPKIVFVHTPARYIWEPEIDQRGNRLFVRLASVVLKRIDRIRSRESNLLIANSDYVGERISKVWGKKSVTVYPPVNVEFFSEVSIGRDNVRTLDLSSWSKSYILGASRFTPQKKLDEVIMAGAKLNLRVIIAGSGSEEARLRKLAKTIGVNCEFVISPTDDELRSLYRNALFYMFPAVEDFGIMPVEAMAAGTPVVGTRAGGLMETVVHGVTGVLLEDFSETSLTSALETVKELDSDACRNQAARFRRSVFIESLMRVISTFYESNIEMNLEP